MAEQSRMDAARDRLSGMADQTQERAREWNRDLDDFIRGNPGRALLIAAAIGFAIGLLFRNRD